MTGIEWTDQVWNPTTGCDRVSPGCDNCYALTMAKRLKGMRQARYQNDGDPRTSGPGFGLTVHLDALNLPLRWRKPRRVFVNSMSDLLHKNVPDDFLAQIFGVMAACPRHTFQVLTKRHGRMRSLLTSPDFERAVQAAAEQRAATDLWTPPPGATPMHWPLPNVWLGVSAEDQKHADLRIPALLDAPAALRFLSCEPLLSPVDLSRWLDPSCWVIIGGESGPGARLCDPEWIRSLVTQCQAAEVPAFVKQLGSVWARANGADTKGGDPQRWPTDLRVREMPTVAPVSLAVTATSRSAP
jgi:protein gp37